MLTLEKYSRRTLAKLQAQNTSLSKSVDGDEAALGGDSSEVSVSAHATESSPIPEDVHVFNDFEEGVDAGGTIRGCIGGHVEYPHSHQTQRPAPDPSGTATPWNPQNLAMGQQPHRHALSRRLLNILGEFPIEDNEGTSDEATVDPEFQDPLWLVAGLEKRGWDLEHASESSTSRPSQLSPGVLTEEEATLMCKWTPHALRGIRSEQRRYFEHGLLGSKRDVAPDLDPIQHGIIDEQRADSLFQAYVTRCTRIQEIESLPWLLITDLISYFDMIHPQWPILDPDIHTVARVRTRSALLTTTILALGSTALTTLRSENSVSHREAIAEALSLHAHVEKVNLVIYATGARSVDIIQAHIVSDCPLYDCIRRHTYKLWSCCLDGVSQRPLGLKNRDGCVPP